MNVAPKKQRRGFAVMTAEQRSAIASKGGKASQASGRGHRFTQEEAREAGRKGGHAAAEKRSATQDPDDEMSSADVMTDRDSHGGA
jgi:general stress protein YciG